MKKVFQKFAKLEQVSYLCIIINNNNYSIMKNTTTTTTTDQKDFSFEVETRTLGTAIVAISVWVEWRTNDNMGPAYKQMRSWKSKSTITLPSGEVFEAEYEKQNRDHIESFSLGKFLQKDGKAFIAVNTRPVGFYMSEVDAKRTREIAEDLAEERRFWAQHDL